MTRFLWPVLRRSGSTESKHAGRGGGRHGMRGGGAVWRFGHRNVWIAPLTWALFAGGMLLAMQTAQAQRPYAPYRPSTPTFSPWLNLYQKNTGPLDNYHTYVQPQIQLWDTLQQQDQNIQRNATSIQSLGQGLSQLQQHGTMRPTGSAGTFMNYSHYYPNTRPGGQATRSAGGRGGSSGGRPSGLAGAQFSGRGF